MSRETEKARENFERYVYARDEGHLDFIKKAEQCISYYENKQWDEAITRELDSKGLPYLTLNKIQSTVNAMTGAYLENRASVSFVASRGGTEGVAKALSRVYHHIANNNDLDHIELGVFEDGVITGRGYFDVRIDFDDQLLGEVTIESLNPKNVMPDPDADAEDPATWNDVIITKWMSEEDIIDLYGGGAQRRRDLRSISSPTFDHYATDVTATMDRFAKRERGGFDDPSRDGIDQRLYRRYRVIERQYKRVRHVDHFVDMMTGDMRPVPNNWGPERIHEVMMHPNITIMKKPIKEIHWLVTVDRFVLFESKGFYREFTVIPFFPYFRRGQTLGAVESLISAQDMYNKVTSQELHVVNTTANSGWMIQHGTLVGMTREELQRKGADTGLVIEYRGENAPQKITPNQIPSGLDRLGFKANKDIFEISGVGESMRGIDRADVSARAIQEKRDAGGTGMGRIFASLAFSRKLLARKVLTLVQDFYTEPRTLRITQDMFREPEEVGINMPDPATGQIHNDLTVGEYDVRLTPTPLRDSHDQTQFDEVMRMKEQGIHIPDYRLIQYSHLDDKDEIAEEVKQLTGGPLTEEAQQRISELEAELKELELEAAQAKIQNEIADAQLKHARTQKILQEIDEGGMSLKELEQLMFKARQEEERLARKDRELDIRETAMHSKFGLDAREQDRREISTAADLEQQALQLEQPEQQQTEPQE
jgi:hypothetical protein